MALWFAALLGLVQGLTEFLPISSTAHLKITTALLGQSDASGAAFTAVIQLGSLAAVIVYFARDLFIDLPRAMFKDPTSPMGRLPILIVIGSIPVVIGGLLLKRHIEGPLRSLYVIAAAMVAVGAIMWLVDNRGAGERQMTDLGYTDALLIGLAQACALVPGTSRSGATICMCLALGMARPEAARFSFLLGIPALAGAGIFELKGLGAIPWTPVIIATIIAFFTSLASIAWLIRWLGTHHLTPFAIYRIIAGIIIAALVLAGVVAA
ncbi:MAG TPA: undecaprenyl-diphosphatase UppP [Kofleriaceae bacterium]|jgi:undecaprenyl-diphosphatase|nr:undecaprenyl-diphosphatase UppP [Kofleriaceae bacterium]